MLRSRDGETVLIVDDEPSVRTLIEEVLDTLGYVSLQAEDGASGLRLLQSKEHIDLLVTDIGLPGNMNGRELADAGSALRPNLKILFITGYAQNAVDGNDHPSRAINILTKPFRMDTLATRIQIIISGSSRSPN